MNSRKKSPETYYSEVASYYDDDAADFEQRYEENPVLQKIRASFREITAREPFNHALEIGCGPGFDVEWAATNFPDSRIDAIDVSPAMIDLARRRIPGKTQQNVRLGVGSVEDIPSVFPDTRYDLIFVFFGGLNTVFDLKKAALDIKSCCSEDARLVLTFVNRYYLTEIPLWLATGRTDKALERIRAKWNGYSDHRKIPSRVYAASDIKKSFSPHFDITLKRGYSIFYPAWYRSHLLPKLGKASHYLWGLDRLLSKTPFWNIGEYSLYELRLK